MSTRYTDAALLVAIGLLCLACAGLPTPDAAAPTTPEEKYQAWRKEHGRPEKPTQTVGKSFGEFRFFYVKGSRGQPVDSVAISPTTMLGGGEPGDWRALLRSGEAEDVHAWIGWLKDMVVVEPTDPEAAQPPLAAYYTPPTLTSEGESTRFQGWYVVYPSETFTRLTVVAGPDNAVEFTHASLDEMLAGTP